MVHDWQMDFGGVGSNIDYNLWFERPFFDVKVFNPYAHSNQKTPLSACYHSHENEKEEI